MSSAAKLVATAGIVCVVLGAAWATGFTWRLGEPYWQWRLKMASSDESREAIFMRIGEYGGEGAFAYLVRSVEDLLSGSGNDVELAGLVAGLVATGDSRVESNLLELFDRYNGDSSARYIAVHLAIGLAKLRGSDFDEAVEVPSPYAKFGVSNFADTNEEQRAADERFARLVAEVERSYGLRDARP